jgi:hypothetical protein
MCLIKYKDQLEETVPCQGVKCSGSANENRDEKVTL